MGLFDTLRLPAEIELPGFEGDPSEIEWQTKSIKRPDMAKFRITTDRRLLKEQCRTERVPEERPRYDEELGGFENDWERAFGMLDRIHEGWEDCSYHGKFEFHASINGDVRRYTAKFTDGELEEIQEGNTLL